MRSPRPLAFAAAFAATAALGLAGLARAEDWKDQDAVGEWALEGEEDGRAVLTTLLVHKRDGNDFYVTRHTTEVSSLRVSTRAGSARRNGRVLEVELDATPGIAGALGGDDASGKVEGAYTLDSGGKIAGKLAGRGRAPVLRSAVERGNRTRGSSGDDRVVAGPYLQDVRPRSVVIAWRTSKKGGGVVELGETPALGRRFGDARENDHRHEVRIEGLEPGRAYFYRVGDGAEPQTSIESFRTAPVPGSADPVRFLAFGDSGSGSKGQLELARRMVAASGAVDFVVHTGDLVYPEGNGPRRWDEWFFEPYADFMRVRCLFPTCGNHDAAVAEEYARTFATPANNPARSETYYSFEWGDAKFVSIDTSSLAFQDGPQARWLRGELASNARRWLVLFTHVPLYTSTEEPECTAVRGSLGALVESSKVDLVVAGHKHRYERSSPIKRFSRDPSYRGTVHVTTGGGGARLSEGGNDPRFAKTEKAFHYVAFSLDRGALVGRAIDREGAVIDELRIEKR